VTGPEAEREEEERAGDAADAGGSERGDDSSGDAGGESGGRSEHLGGTGNPPQADRSLADPAEHPEQHAARGTGEGAEAETQEGTENEFLDSEEHSEAEGPFGTG
jgi:hypothetical protein